ncbi:hypothetical protein [Rhizobacter sp. Root1221]|uniref:hypothetical protein n=1 Tax=Rhizobacter sp. Root1221 TaxID=1736433 RepID=UPI0006F27D25|nr:hypothetical protein [Rhizobacter sp. Root1221]KQW02230.1 hypothetical protein ASC87_13450 [Rhizobacter sp. Root1221]
MEFILVLYIYAGMFAKGDSVTVQAVPGFTSEAACKAAGKAAEPLVAGSAKELRFICLKK